MISVTVSPQKRPWHGPIPQRTKAFAWLGPAQPAATAATMSCAVTPSQRQTMVSPLGMRKA